MKTFFLSILLLLSACHPLVFWHPSHLPIDKDVHLEAKESAHLKKDVEVHIDSHGIPHIFGESAEDVSYGLGFMHARDRSFQLNVLRHAGEGNLGALFGEKVLKLDRKLRLLTFQLQEQYNQMGPRDKAILKAYAAGVNRGWEHTGRGAQHFILGVKERPFEPYETLAIARLQSWDLANDMKDELIRARIDAKLPTDSNLREYFFAGVPSGGIPIVKNEYGEKEKKVNMPFAYYSPNKDARNMFFHGARYSELKNLPKDTNVEAEVQDFIGFENGGASNSWVVSGEHTESGHAMLANDPHLKHHAPGVFYLAHLNVNGKNMVGATMAGLPGILIGYSDTHAWGATSSFVDAQDLVEIKVDPRDKNYYLVDGNRHAFGLANEKFITGSGKEDFVVEEWKTTIFGPVLPSAYDEEKPEGKTYALLWSGFVPGSVNANMITGFWDLAVAKNLKEATVAVDKISIAGLSVALAFNDDKIAYRLGTHSVVRQSNEPTYLPRDGSTMQAGWKGFLLGENKPYLNGSKKGFIVAANQRVVESSHSQSKYLGIAAATPHRALRITNMLESQIESGKKLSPEGMVTIQQDITNPKDKKYANYFSDSCPKSVETYDVETIKALCQAISNFDGIYAANSMTAMPFLFFFEALRDSTYAMHLGEALASQLGPRYMGDTIFEEALDKKIAGQPSPLLDNVWDIATSKAFERALIRLEDTAGLKAANWRYGKFHHLSSKGPLANAPLMSGFFKTDPIEQGGHKKTPRAENGFPVSEGAAFRMVVELSDPVQGGIMAVTGNSGHPGHKHFEDLFPKWSKGELLYVATNLLEIKEAATGKLTLSPLSDRP